MKHLILLCFGFLFLSCGSLTETEEAGAGCRDLIEQELWQDAIDCFENGDYSDAPATDLEAEDYLYLLQWSGAYGGKYGLVGSSIVEGIAGGNEGGNEGEGNSGGAELPIDLASKVTALVSAGTLSTGISDMARAIALIEAYPIELRTVGGDNAVYYASEVGLVGLLFTSFLVELQKKDFEISLESGELTADQLVAKANAVISTLESGGDVVGDPDLAAAIDEQLEQINSQPGSNSAEKLEELLGGGS